MPSPARAAALTVLAAVHAGRLDLGEALARARRTLTDDRDRALVTEIVTGTLRHRAALDYQLARFVSRPLPKLDAAVLDSLRLGAYQLLHLARVPQAAIVNDAAELVRRAGKASAAGFVNAVLRKLARERGALPWPPRPATVASAADRAALITHLAVVHSHPAWLVERWVDRYGAEAAERWLAFNNETPALCLAANPLVTTRDQLAADLAAEGVETRRTPVSPGGLTVRKGQALGTQAFRDGRFVVQDEASQLVPFLAGGQPGERILDACAAPGNKTLTLAAAAGQAGRVVAADVRARRVRLLHDTLRRCQATARTRIVHVPTDGALPFAPAAFDRVLVDAPCSGLGTVRRDPDLRWRRTPDDLPGLAQAQVDLLHRVAPLVKPGGTLVYSTCSSEPEENEAVVARFLEQVPGFSVRLLGDLPWLPPALHALASAEGYLVTRPFRDGLEAFFGAVLTRRR